MSTITVRVPDELEKIMEKFCKKEDRTKSWLIKKAVQEKLEDWEDLQDALSALKKHKKNPKTIDHEDLVKKLGLTKKDLK